MKRLPLMDSIALSCTVYDHKSFLPVFREQASKAEFSLIIMAPYITWFGLDRMIDVIDELVKKKRQVCIAVRPPEGYYMRREALEPEKQQRIEYFQKIIDKLRATGAHVTLSEKIHEKVAIIDGRYLWDGSLNIMSFNKELTTERMTCIDSYYMALCAIGKHELLHCPECHASRVKTKGLRYILLDSDNLGAKIREKRIARGLTQAQLSELTGVSRRIIKSSSTSSPASSSTSSQAPNCAESLPPNLSGDLIPDLSGNLSLDFGGSLPSDFEDFSVPPVELE